MFIVYRHQTITPIPNKYFKIVSIIIIYTLVNNKYRAKICFNKNVPVILWHTGTYSMYSRWAICCIRLSCPKSAFGFQQCR